MFLRLLFLITSICSAGVVTASCIQDPDFSGTYNYEIRDTPYGDFSGKIILQKQKEGYKINIVNNKGEQFNARIIRLKNNRIVLATNFEHADAMLYGYFQGDILSARVEAKGDAFLYKLIARK
jgi:hypothetical protein